MSAALANSESAECKVVLSFTEGDYDSLLLHLDDSFRTIKNKFVMPNSEFNMPAKYLHNCER